MCQFSVFIVPVLVDNHLTPLLIMGYDGFISQRESSRSETKELKMNDLTSMITTKELTIAQLLRRISEGALDLAADFQRHADLWDNDRKSRLIESVIVRIPLPAFYIDATNEEKWLVIDGRQRLTALKQFVSDKTLKLSGVEHLKKELNGKTCAEINRSFQRRIEETQVPVHLLMKETPPEIKQTILLLTNRIN